MSKRILLIGCLLLTFISCKKEYRSSIPDYPVYLRRDLHLDAMELLTPNNYKVYPTTAERPGSDLVGYGGILLCSSFDGENIFAFDMACPKECSRTVRVYPDGVGNAICEKCGSKFYIAYGTGNCIGGEAAESLKVYRVTRSGSQIQVTLQ